MATIEEEIEMFLRSVVKVREIEERGIPTRSFTSLRLERDHVVFETEDSGGSAFSGYRTSNAVYMPKNIFFEAMQGLRKTGSAAVNTEGFRIYTHQTEEYSSSDAVGLAYIGRATIQGSMRISGNRLEMKIDSHFGEDATSLRADGGQLEREEVDAAVKEQKQKYFR